MKVVNFGSLNIDHVYAVDHFCRAGETIHTKSYTQNAGGKGLNQSIAVARSGQPLFHAGALGAGGEQLEKTLKAWGKARRPDNGHGKRLSSAPPAAEKKGLFSIFDRSDRGGRTEKSDRGFIFDDYDGDSGKRGRNRRR